METGRPVLWRVTTLQLHVSGWRGASRCRDGQRPGLRMGRHGPGARPDLGRVGS